MKRIFKTRDQIDLRFVLNEKYNLVLSIFERISFIASISSQVRADLRLENRSLKDLDILVQKGLFMLRLSDVGGVDKVVRPSKKAYVALGNIPKEVPTNFEQLSTLNVDATCL